MGKNATKNKLTPAMQQFMAIKQRHPETIVFFRMGDFYETFFEDAKVTARSLGIVLTSRGGENPIPLAGFPYHALDNYLRKMVAAGHRVAIVEQMEDPKLAKGVVKRDVVRIVTPGTLTESTLLSERESNYIAAIAPGKHHAGLAWADLSTGEFRLLDCKSEDLLDELTRLGPAECLAPEGWIERNGDLVADFRTVTEASFAGWGAWFFEADEAERTLLQHFEVASLEGFGIGTLTPGVAAAGAVLSYLSETQRGALGHITSLQCVHRGAHMVVDQNTLRSLEVLRTLRSGQVEGSLIAAVDQTCTPMGGRLLRQWFAYPLVAIDPIVARHQGIGALKESTRSRRQLRDLLGQVADLQRIIARLGCGRGGPRDLLALGGSLMQVEPIRQQVDDLNALIFAELLEQLDPLPKLRDLLGRAIAENCAPTLRDGGVIRDGYSEQLDRLRDIATGGQNWLVDFQKREAGRTGIATLRVGFNKVFGYYIEITHANTDKVPADYVRKQTLKGAERYITDELKRHETEVLSAEEKVKAMEASLFEEIRRAVAEQIAAIQKTAGALATLDCLAGLAELAAKRKYCRPEMVEEPILEIEDGRHPVLEQTLAGQFVPNDTVMGEKQSRVLVITGPNMAGKSTYIRQVALLCMMAQAGSWVPAARAKIGVADRIFARVGAADELARGQSTFMVEMTETAAILRSASRSSLVIFDEVGRGTSTFDGLSLAWAVTEHMAAVLEARTLFATHYHEITELSRVLPTVANFNVAVREWGEKIVFLHRIQPGGTDKSYGIHVARLAGVPEEVVQRSKEILADLEEGFAREMDLPALARRARKQRITQMMLFADPAAEPVMEKLREVNPDEMTPVEALAFLSQLKREVAPDNS